MCGGVKKKSRRKQSSAGKLSSGRYFCVTLQQSLLSAQHFFPAWQQAGFSPEQQADFV
jgi:hypothetical protein